MKSIPYLIFNGNCKQAMKFYQKCLGGTLQFQTIGESPLADKLPKSLKKYILHAHLATDLLSLYASDISPDTGLIRGNNFVITVLLDSEQTIHVLYKKLSRGSIVATPLEKNHWKAYSASITDKYGIQWMLHLPK